MVLAGKVEFIGGSSVQNSGLNFRGRGIGFRVSVIGKQARWPFWKAWEALLWPFRQACSCCRDMKRVRQKDKDANPKQ